MSQQEILRVMTYSACCKVVAAVLNSWLYSGDVCRELSAECIANLKKNSEGGNRELEKAA